MEYEIHTTGDELTHWGIKGMRWGIRRYQNKDGSLTPAGKKKLRAEQAKVREQEAINKKRKSVQASFDRLEARKKAAADEKKALDDAERSKLDKGKKGGSGKKGNDDEVQPAKKSLKDMTDAELNAAVNRARMEEAYRQLHPEPAPKRSLMSRMREEMLVPAAINAGRQFVQNALNKAGENLLKGKVDPNSTEALKKIHEKLDLEQKIDKLKNPDKYLTEEDRNKRQQREFDAEDRAAKKEGYANAADKAVKTSEAAEAARKAKADEAARVANDVKSQEYYNSTYNNKGVGERTQVSSNNTVSNVNSLDIYNRPVTDISPSSTSRGRSEVTNLLDGPTTRPKGSDKLATYDEDGKFIGYWSDIRGDSDGII